MYNRRPITARQKIRIMVGLTILAWATQTLFQQWGFGQEATEERFVPAATLPVGATLELRGEATVVGQEVSLKQIARWDDRDAEFFGPVADLVVLRIGPKQPFRAIKLEDLRQLLYDAGVNLGSIRFSGATACTVTRSDVEFDERTALEQWASAKGTTDDSHDEPAPARAKPVDDSPRPPAVEVFTPPTTQPVVEHEPARSLKQLLLADLAERLAVDVNLIQLTFSQRDQKLLVLAEPQFSFDVTPRRVRNLGPVTWEVVIRSEGLKPQKITIDATARLWQSHLVTARSLAFGQVLREEDFKQERVLVDRLPEDLILTREQALHQSSVRQLPAGTVLTARLVEAVPLVRTGQFVTITLKRGSVMIRTVARAMDGGGFGQAIRVKNEATKDIYEVVITGAQEAQIGPLEPVAAVE